MLFRSIETTKPEQEGKIEIMATKAIKTDIQIDKEKIESYKQLKTEGTIKATNGETTIIQEPVETNINLIEPVTKAELQITPEILSTTAKNENVQIKAILNTSNTANSLYKNPKLEIVLPEYIEQIDITKQEILFNEELQIEQIEVEQIGANKIIKIKLQGEQTKYDIAATSKGANIILNANIVTKEFTPTKQVEVAMYITNEASNIYEQEENGKGVVKENIKLVSPVGIWQEI